MNNDQMQATIFEFMVIGCLIFILGAIALHLLPFYVVYRLWANVSPEDRETAFKWAIFAIFIGVAIGVYKQRDIFQIAAISAFTACIVLIEYSWRNVFGIPPKQTKHEKIVNERHDYSEFDDMGERGDYSEFDVIDDQDDFAAAFDEQQRQEQEEAEKIEQYRLAQDDFAAAFDERQKPPSKPNKLNVIVPAGMEYRHPDDEKLWARVDDLGSARVERTRCLAKIIRAENNRTNPIKRSFATTPYGVDKRHRDDAQLWLVVDNHKASDGDRKRALRQILNKEDRRAGRVSSAVEYIRSS